MLLLDKIPNTDIDWGKVFYHSRSVTLVLLNHMKLTKLLPGGTVTWWSPNTGSLPFISEISEADRVRFNKIRFL